MCSYSCTKLFVKCEPYSSAGAYIYEDWECALTNNFFSFLCVAAQKAKCSVFIHSYWTKFNKFSRSHFHLSLYCRLIDTSTILQQTNKRQNGIRSRESINGLRRILFRCRFSSLRHWIRSHAVISRLRIYWCSLIPSPPLCLPYFSSKQTS